MQFNDRTLAQKLSAIIIFTSIVPQLIISLVSYFQISSMFENKVNNYNSQIIRQISIKMDYYHDEMNKVSFLIASDGNVNMAIKQEGIYSDKNLAADRYNCIVGYLSALKNFQSFNFNIHLYSYLGEDYTTNNFGMQNTVAISQKAWFKSLFAGKKQASIISFDNYNNVDYMFLARNVFEPLTNAFLGTVVIELRSSMIDNYISKINLESGAIILFTDDSDKILYSVQNTKNPQVTDLYQFLSSKSDSSAIVDKAEYILASDFTDLTHWKIISAIPATSYLKEYKRLTFITFGISAACFLVTLLFGLSLLYNITKPIHKLRNLMKQAESGDFTVSVELKRKDEIGQLYHSYNVMLAKIDSLINTVYQTQLKIKDAELRALQARINPHFLYNTLGSISMTALVNNDIGVVNMLNVLVEFFRYNVSTNKFIVPLKDEIKHVQNYVHLQQFRYGEKLQMECDIDEQLMGQNIMKLVLQPIVENSILHGFENGKNKGEIKITGELVNEQIIICIIDNGMGIEKDKLNEINGTLCDPSANELNQQTGSIGLKNVHDRINLYYGPSYGLTISSEKGNGTKIIITFPANFT